MVGTNLKAETMKLMDKRSEMEAEMNAIIDGLCLPGGPGLSGNLIDSEGFPRSDIDIHSVRAQRHRLSELRNNHTDITEKINQSIQLLHSAKLTPTTAFIKDSDMIDQDSSSGVSPSSIAVNMDLAFSRPFAVVDEITEASPAAEDGLQLGDQIVKFGEVERGEGLLQRLASEMQQKQGQAVSLVVIRQGAFVNFSVTLRAWSGRGLLGCHFRVL